MTNRFKEEPVPQISRALLALWLMCRALMVLGGLSAGAIGSLFVAANQGEAAEYVESFEDGRPSWDVLFSKHGDVRVRGQRRSHEVWHNGRASEEIQIALGGRSRMLARLEHELPRSAPIDDLSLSVAVRSNAPGTVLAVRMIFPRQIDPRNGRTLSSYLLGDRYTETNRWQVLRAQLTRRAVAERLVRLRAELRTENLDLGGMYFDRAVLIADLPVGMTEFFLDDLTWSGYAQPTDREVVPVVAEDGRQAERIELRLDRLVVDGKPTILRFAPHHDEPFDRLQLLGLNLIWIDDYSDLKRIQQLRDYGLWAMATPPRAQVDDTDAAGNVSLKMRDFDETTEGILAWYKGTRIPADAREELSTQIRLVRAADRKWQRPIIGDIGGLERTYSRILDGVGLSRHPLHTEFSIADYRQFLSQKMRQLRPGTFVTTWLQTESELQSGDKSPVVEPEQIRQLAYAALTAGCRGMGYWKRSAFDVEFPGAREREFMIAIINQEIDLLEPWLATQTVVHFHKVPLGTTTETKTSFLDRNKPTSTRLRSSKAERERKQPKPDNFQPLEGDEIELAIIHSPNGLLLLPIWYERDSQFVPGQMARREIVITVPGIPDTATVWELSTTRVESVRHERAPSGVQIRLQNFDQVAALVVSTDPGWGEIMRQKVELIRERSAALWLSLAKAKLARVREVDAELQQLGLQMGFGVPDSPQLLDLAATQISIAEEKLQRLLSGARSNSGGVAGTGSGYAVTNEFDDIREACRAALQALRIVQRAHWEQAVRDRPSPLFSPYTVSFQTLPEHWRFIERIGASPTADHENRLPSGDFNGTDTTQMLSEGWQHTQGDLDGIQASAELTQASSARGFTLRLLAVPRANQEPPLILDGTPISVRTPPIAIHAGQIVHISGAVRVPDVPAASLEGVTLHESLTGSRLHWKQTRGWQRFECVREVATDTSLTIRITLHGLGEAQFDDLRVITYESANAIGPLQSASASASDSSAAESLGFRQAIP